MEKTSLRSNTDCTEFVSCFHQVLDQLAVLKTKDLGHNYRITGF